MLLLDCHFLPPRGTTWLGYEMVVDIVNIVSKICKRLSKKGSEPNTFPSPFAVFWKRHSLTMSMLEKKKRAAILVEVCNRDGWVTPPLPARLQNPGPSYWDRAFLGPSYWCAAWSVICPAKISLPRWRKALGTPVCPLHPGYSLEGKPKKVMQKLFGGTTARVGSQLILPWLGLNEVFVTYVAPFQVHCAPPIKVYQTWGMKNSPPASLRSAKPSRTNQGVIICNTD